MTFPKPYLSIPIKECGEPMVVLPDSVFATVNPHPYIAAGAPYEGITPWILRKTIVESLIEAQIRLSHVKPGWKIKLYDAYRPNPVCAFMVEREFAIQAKKAGLDPANLSSAEREKLKPLVYRLWAVPSDDPSTPPPHCTGAAFDCTLQDETGREADMGSRVDENTERSLPDAFANATDEAGKKAHAARTLLHDILREQGFVRHYKEWWHFSRGDQLATWIEREKNPGAFAIYGHAPL